MKYSTINLAILLDSNEPPAWQFHLVKELLAAKHVSVSNVLINEIPEPASGRIMPGLLFSWFQKHQSRRQQLCPDACEPRSVNELGLGSNKTRSLKYSSGRLRDPGYLRQELADSHVDVILALGGLQMIDSLSDMASFGVWYFSHDCGQTCIVDGSSIGLWEVLEKRPHTRSALVIQRPDGAGRKTAYESYSAVEFDAPMKSRNEHLWKISYFVPRALRLLRQVGSDEFFCTGVERDNDDPTLDSNRKWSLTNSKLFIPMLRYVIRRICHKVARKIFDERWTLMFSTTGRSRDMSEFEMIAPPDGRFWADPFAFPKNGSNFVFFEDASTRSGLGRISVMRISHDGRPGAVNTILDKPYHLSYPFVFQWNGVTYLVPETGGNRSIELYRCIEFPYRWEYVHNLMDDVSAYDATFVEYDRLWWMFVNIQQHVGASTWDELCVFYSNSPISRDWQPHSRNPIISDVRSARPAGRIFAKDGHLHRPSQDCSIRYGYALNINKILELTKTTYREQLVERIQPDWNASIKAVHTLNCENQLTVIDVVHRTLKIPFRRR